MSNETGQPPDRPRKRRPIPLIVGRSPIEFVLVGPKGRDHGIVARSKEAQIDLIGFAASERVELDMSGSSLTSQVFSRTIPLFPFSVRTSHRVPTEPRAMNAVTSDPVESNDPEADPRKQRYRFCWVGECTSAEREEIQRVFDRQLPDIREAIRKLDGEAAEWALSPIILECTVGITNWEKKRGPVRAIAAAYLSILMVAMVIGTIVLIVQAFKS